MRPRMEVFVEQVSKRFMNELKKHLREIHRILNEIEMKEVQPEDLDAVVGGLPCTYPEKDGITKIKKKYE